MGKEMSIPIITVYSDPSRAEPLIRSAEKHEWTILPLQVEWKGFGTKLISVYNYLVEHPEITEFVFCDAYDVVVLGSEDEFMMKKQAHFGEVPMITSAEKGCWPYQDAAKYYPEVHSDFKYLNSGLYWCKSSFFKEYFEYNKPLYEWDDQWYLTNWFLPRDIGVQLDYNQCLFNSHSFIADGEYTYENNRIQIMGNEPVFIHGNGGGLPKEVLELI